MIGRIALVAALVAATALGGCKKDPVDPEAEVAALITAVEEAVEAGDMGEIKDHLADDYADPRGNDKKALVGMVQLQLLRRRNIHILSRIESITVEPGARRARAIVHAAGGASPIADVPALANVRADIFRFDITFQKPDDAWKVLAVQWKRASAGDFSDDE